MNSIFSIARFKTVAMFRGHFVTCVVVALSLLAFAGTALALASAKHSEALLSEELDQLRETRRVAALQAKSDVPPVSQKQAEQLPVFVSHEFTQQFHALASSTGLPVDEVGYVLEASESKPYLRYRVNMAVKTRYQDVRKFIAALAADMPHVTLDSIQCSRETAAAQPITCALAFSAFFAKA